MQNRYTSILIILLIFANLAGINLDYKIQKQKTLFIGTPFDLVIDIYSQPDDSIFTTEIDTLDIFILKGDIIQNEFLDDDGKRTNLKMTFQPFDVGEFTFPELEFAVKSDNEIRYLSTKEFQITVHSIISDSSSSVKDIAPLLKVAPRFWDYMIPILVLSVIMAGIIFLFKFLKSRKKVELIPEKINICPPHLIALELMEKLRKSNFLEKGNFLEYYFRLSYILRLFIERYYKIKAVEMTSREIKMNLEITDQRMKSKMINYLRSTDLVKFARKLPTLEEAEDKFVWLYEYLNFFNSSSEQNRREKEDA